MFDLCRYSGNLTYSLFVAVVAVAIVFMSDVEFSVWVDLKRRVVKCPTSNFAEK